MAKTHRRLLPVPFGDWQYLVECGVEELAIKCFMGASGVLLGQLDWEEGTSEKEATEAVTKFFIGTIKGDFTTAEYEPWLDTILARPRVKRLYTRYTTEAISDSAKRIHVLLRHLKMSGGHPNKTARMVMNHLLQYHKELLE